MNRSTTIITLFSVCMGSGLLSVVSPPAAGAERPNIVLIVTDDQGYADVGFNGCTDIPTPNIDRIAAEGIRFTNGYVSYSVCGPSRAGLMTGRYQDRFGFVTNPTIDPTNPTAGIPLTEQTLAEALATAGYASMAIGKWHLGTHPTLQPLERGFDEFFGFLSGGHDYFPERLTLNDLSECKQQWDWYRTKLLRNKQRVEINDYLTDALSDAAVDFIDRQATGKAKEQPFFVYLAYNAPHTPMQATEKYLNRFQHIENPRRRTYAAMVSAVDDGVGRLLDKLDEHLLAENTLVVFLSDNGGPLEKNASRNTPLRGGEGSPFEGGIRVPFAVRWTGTIPAGRDYDQPVISLDVFATAAAHAGASVSPERPLDGVNLVPYLTGEKTGAPHDRLFWRFHHRDTFVIRDGGDKLIADPAEGPLLFDLSSDASEKTNRAKTDPGKVKGLQTPLDEWKKELKPPAFPGLGSWLK